MKDQFNCRILKFQDVYEAGGLARLSREGPTSQSHQLQAAFDSLSNFATYLLLTSKVRVGQRMLSHDMLAQQPMRAIFTD